MQETFRRELLVNARDEKLLQDLCAFLEKGDHAAVRQVNPSFNVLFLRAPNVEVIADICTSLYLLVVIPALTYFDAHACTGFGRQRLSES